MIPSTSDKPGRWASHSLDYGRRPADDTADGTVKNLPRLPEEVAHVPFFRLVDP